jgi:hypothetical protein
MAFKSRFCLVTLGVVGQLFLFGHISTEPLEASDNASQHEMFLSASVPERDRLNLVSFLPVIVEGVIVGRVVVYDDVTTRRAADYLELYDSAGHLLALGWFDRFGIERIAVDRGLLEDAGKLEEIFVVLLDGDSI